MSEQLIKKNKAGEYFNIMPKSWIEAIKDKNTGQTLVEILQGFNMYFLSYNGNTSSTRCLVPMILRKKGLWITYVKYDGNVYTEWYAASDVDDKSWGDSSNWRIGNNTLVGDITISSNGNWVINGTETEFKAIGEKGNTPLIRVANNKLQVSYDLGDTYIDVTDNPVYTKFRWLSTSEDTQANIVGRIQASTDEGKTWTNMSNDFINNLHISKYIGANESLPTSGIAEGTIYAKGPTYAVEDTSNSNPIYRLWVYAWKNNTLAWQDNGEFTSINAGIVQETGNNENVVMSQKAVSAKFTELEQGIIYDVSAHNNGAVFESLSALLSSHNLSTLIPTSVRHKGITIRFIQGSVQSSDNKYVQYRLMSTAWSTNVSNWQGVDDEPTVGSDNLVKSGGVANVVLPLSTTINNELKDINSIKDEIDYQTSDSQQTIFFNIGGVTGETFILIASVGFTYGAAILGKKVNGDIITFPGYIFYTSNTFTLTDNYIQLGIKVLANNTTQHITLKLKSSIKSKIDNTYDNVNFLQNIIYKDSPKIDETNILQTATTYTRFSYDQELKRVETSEAYTAYEVDVSNYELFLIKFHHYCVVTNANYFGFVTEDGSVIESHLGDKNSVLFFYQLIVPKGAKYFRFTYINNNPDWQAVCFVSREALNSYLSLNYKVSDIESKLSTIIPTPIDAFNNVKINRERISLFMGMYKLKAVDKTNRLVVSFNGDSIIGSQLDNITKSDEYLTGNFPPNMSKMIMARQFLDDYQFDDADVVYRNIIHSDWVKSSGAFEISNGKDEPTKTFNEIEVYGTANIGDSAEITVTGYKFFKLVWSEYTNTSKFQVLYSVNGGDYAPWYNPTILPEYIEVTASSRCMQKYAVLTLNPAKTYKFKIIATENPNNILFWGCEMWNNPRLDVIVEAYSGSTATSQVRGMLEAYHSNWHTPALIVSNILSINDYSYIVGSDSTIDKWMVCNRTLYNRAIDNGIALLLFTPWQSTNYLTKNAVNVAIQNNLPYIDIQKKQTVLTPSSNIYGSDGTHLSDYGNTYFYDELKRVLNDE